MKILSLNCHGLPLTKKKTRLEKIAQHIAEAGAEVVCFQEVILKSDLKYFEGLGMEVVCETGRKLIKGGLVTLSKLPVEESSFQRFKVQGSRLSRQLSDRVLGKGMLRVKVGGWEIFNVHLVRAYGKNGINDKAQRQQMEELISVIRGREKVMVVGDLNIDEATELYGELMTTLVDPTKGLGASYPKEKEKIDYILSCEDFGVGRVCFLDELVEGADGVSDHRGIWLEW